MISIVEIFGQAYERFMMRLEDLKWYMQEIILKQYIEAIKRHDT